MLFEVRSVMEQIVCRCNWGIPGVEALPPHGHVYWNTGLEGTGRYHEAGPFRGQEIMRLVPDPDRINLFVNWKQIARFLVTDSVPR